VATLTRELEATLDFAPDQAAQALLKLRCAVDHCHDAVFITDSTGKIEFVNAAFEVLIGYSTAEVMEGGLRLIMERSGESIRDGEPLADPSRVLLEEVLRKGSYRGRMRAARKGGRSIELDIAMTLVRDHRTRTASVVCTGRDITDESELQVELRDARRMDTIATAASGFAHDLNNLLMVINAYAELGLQTLYCDHPLRRNLQEILSAAQRAADLTRQLPASGGGRLPGLQAVNLNSIVQDSCRLLPRVLGEDVDVRISLREDVGCIRADPARSGVPCST
jgi:two-component system, cell cycle sensor histidine kinase and response regulator CckA